MTDSLNPEKQLYDAARDGNTEGIKLALSRGANINWSNPNVGNWTPLHVAASRNKVQSISFLIKENADKNCGDKLGQTPVMLAARFGHKESVRALLSEGADYTITDNTGNTAIELAYNFPRVLQVLKEYRGVLELSCAVQKYAACGKYGSASEVARLKLKDPSFFLSEQEPYAELWMGTHITGPSIISYPPSINGLQLSKWIPDNLFFLGDVELNPGPMIDDRPDIFLLLQWLEPLVDWKPFGLLLPGITKQDVTLIKDFAIDTEQSKGALFSKWLKKNPTATWRDVLNALTKRQEINLLQTINDQLQVNQCTGGNTDSPTSTVPVVSSSVSEPVTSTTSGNPKDILRTYFDKLVHAISVNLYNVTDALYAKDLIPQQTKEEMHVMGVTDKEKASKLVNVIQTQLEVYHDQKQHLIKICHVLVCQQHRTLTDIVSSILKELGQSIPDNVASISLIPDDVQGYADNMRQHYKHQPIVATDWPPRIGKDFFGRLALVEKQKSSTQAESAWHLLRGQVDETVKLTENKEISIEDILQPTDSSLSLRVVIDGPPGIGKTTLCRKLLNMWSNGTLPHQQYDLVLYCPLRNSNIATATTLADLFEYESDRVSKVVDWLSGREGKGLLIIFDGWDELSERLRQSSLAARIIYGRKLFQCSVIVTSRSYASSLLLLKLHTRNRHVQVIGFSEKEISTVIIRTLQKDPKLAQELIDNKRENDKNFVPTHFTTTQSSKDSQLAVELINNLTVRNDIQSLCYIPLVCSMVIIVYYKEGGHLPTTLTQLYENFILQTIRRHVEIKHGIDPYTLGSLSLLPSQFAKPLQEMCQLAYTNLANTTMTFPSHRLQSLSEAVKEDYLGLMTTFIEYDEKNYQFLHLSIQEFLAAWWIAKHEEKTEEVFKDHFDDDHFRMCLRFVAGLTHLEHDSYQQYFNKEQHDLQCKKKPLFVFETFHLSYFNQNPESRSDDIKMTFSDFNCNEVPILLFQLLYESQNTTLCQVLAKSINNHSLCLDWYNRVSKLSLFDWLCLSFCINNSNITWSHLHLIVTQRQRFQSLLITDGLTQCKTLQVFLEEFNHELLHKFLQPSLLRNIQECYCKLQYGEFLLCHALLQFLGLSQLKILHLVMDCPTVPTVDNTDYTNKCTELEKCIKMNSTLQEMRIIYSGLREFKTNTITTVIRGVTRNKKIKSLSIIVELHTLPPPPLPDGVIEQLLTDNNTLQALVLDIPDRLFPSSLNIVQVNTPLNALEIGLGREEWSPSKLMKSLFSTIKGLHCLILPDPYPAHLLFHSHPSLHALTLPLDTAESAIELFTILQTNTTLKALSVEIWEERVYTSSMGTSLQDMLTQNQTLKYLEINYNDFNINNIPSLFLSFLTTGLRHNTSLKQLSVPIPLIEKITTFVNVISQKNNLTELKVNFTLDHLCSLEKLTLMLFDQGLPAVTTILRSHATIKQLKIACMYDINFHSFETDKWIEKIHNFYLAIFIHPSLEYVEIQNTPLVQSFTFLKEMMIGIRREAQPKTQLLIVSTSVLSISSLLFFDDYGKSSDRTINDVRKEKEDSFDIHGEKNKKDYYEESSQGNMDACE
uniref:Uncharacterized protein n=1 Tax=Amphimedon queenslandica TaxID=400682 RepID=A0A1X7U2K4_AMPQE